ncbi:MAG: hypothetical protein ACLVG7_11125 [Negativibacillus sp.]
MVSSYPGTQQFYLSYKQPAGAQQLPNRLFIFMEQIDGWCPAGSLFDLHEKKFYESYLPVHRSVYLYPKVWDKIIHHIKEVKRFYD